MQQIIDNIRNKPHHKRNQIVWAIAAVVIVLLVIVWIIVGNGRKAGDTNFFQTVNQDYQEGREVFDNPLE